MCSSQLANRIADSWRASVSESPACPDDMGWREGAEAVTTDMTRARVVMLTTLCSDKSTYVYTTDISSGTYFTPPRDVNPPRRRRARPWPGDRGRAPSEGPRPGPFAASR